MRKDALEHALPDLTTRSHTLIVHALFAKLVLRVFEPPDLGTRGNTREEKEAAKGDRKTDATILFTLANKPEEKRGNLVTYRW